MEQGRLKEPRERAGPGCLCALERLSMGVGEDELLDLYKSQDTSSKVRPGLRAIDPGGDLPLWVARGEETWERGYVERKEREERRNASWGSGGRGDEAACKMEIRDWQQADLKVPRGYRCKEVDTHCQAPLVSYQSDRSSIEPSRHSVVPPRRVGGERIASAKWAERKAGSRWKEGKEKGAREGEREGEREMKKHREE
ncbi:hypothetical protein FA13DRAFT_1717905 [Coprinellus micaceus]|uniref:Uncharacterized protein n=1 Tax=Coprinellus micaceus TaxID=71717 RepID=A0A4Y7SEQ7_COPMI|nr:hypothetical protein FA13DRAFT_1717905 [Coprinellus micaceus]